MARIEKGFDFVSDEVFVLGKFDGEFEGRPYFKVQIGGVGWSTNISCTVDVFNMIEEEKKYQFEGRYKINFDGTSSVKFIGVLPVK